MKKKSLYQQKIIFIIFLLFFIFISNQSFSINKVDSLLKEINKSNLDTTKIRLYNEIGKMYFGNSNDTALIYYNKALNLSENIKDKNYKADSYYNIADVYQSLGDYEKSLEYFQNALTIYKKNNNQEKIAFCLIQIGTVRHDLKENKKALENYNKAVIIANNIDNKQLLAYAYNNIANIYIEQDNDNLALVNYKKSLKLYYELDLEVRQAAVIANIGILYQGKNKFNKAIIYLKKSLKIFKKYNKQDLVTDLYGYIADTYVSIADNTNDQRLKNIGYQKAIVYADSALILAKKLKLLPYQINDYEILFKAYNGLNNSEKALYYFEQHKIYKDSLIQKNSVRAIQDMEIKYHTREKEQENEMQKQRIKNQKYLTYFILTGLIFMLVIAFVLFRLNKNKKKTNQLLQKKNTEINQKNEEIITQNEVLRQQKEEIMIQNESLYQQKEEISTQTEHLKIANEEITKQEEEIRNSHNRTTDSINYALRIQTAVFPSTEILKNSFSEYFVFNKPRDIVSGDFYWFYEKHDKVSKNLIKLIAVADCTGHGVPGAFVSMLGITLLNEIVSSIQKIQANTILEELRIKLKTALHQTGKHDEQEDGLDIALCVINTKTNQLQFSGANNPLYLIKNRQEDIESQEENNELLIYKPNYQPIGIYYKEFPFINQEIQLQKNDQLYLFSDGFADQFGGKKHKKFNITRFRKLILSIADRPMHKQKQIIENTYNEWTKRNFTSAIPKKCRQIDDILIVGVKI